MSYLLFLFSTTLLLLDTLQLKQKKLPVLDKTVFSFSIRTQMKKEIRYIQYGPRLLLQKFCILYLSVII
jgi:hypothetical protein